MDRIYHKPYLAELYGVSPAERVFVYPREDMAAADIFDYLILDGGAALFMADTFGDAKGATLLGRTLDGTALDFLRDEDGRVDFGRSYHFCDRHGMPRRHEWQSWPQRLYYLLPVAHAYMRTQDASYAALWLTLLREWVAACPYEPLEEWRPHVETSMMWRDMQSSWRTQTLLYSIYMLTSHGEVFPREVWREIYAFLVLCLDHLAGEGESHLRKDRLGNHTLQMSAALLSGGTLLPELPNAARYRDVGRRVMAACFERNVLADGGTREMGPSYNHFIARLYLEGERHCALNGYESFAGLYDSLVRQYEWLDAMADRNGYTHLLSDGYRMDARADVSRCAALLGFTPREKPASFLLPESGHAVLRRGEWELTVDAQDSVGGHQHFGRVQPLLSYGRHKILVDTGCPNYDRGDLYRYAMSAEAHSVVCCDAFPDRKDVYGVRVTDFSPKIPSLTVEVTAENGQDRYVWRRTLDLSDTELTVTDRVRASRPLDFYGQWYMPGRATVLGDGTAEGGVCYKSHGTVVRQALDGATVTLTSSLPLTLTPAVGMGEDMHITQNARLTWRHTGDDFTVTTRIACCETDGICAFGETVIEKGSVR